MPARFYVAKNGENNIFHDKAKFKQYLPINPALQKVLEENPQPKEVNYINENIGKYIPSFMFNKTKKNL